MFSAPVFTKVNLAKVAHPYFGPTYALCQAPGKCLLDDSIIPRYSRGGQCGVDSEVPPSKEDGEGVFLKSRLLESNGVAKPVLRHAH